jgi:hypothetical protein
MDKRTGGRQRAFGTRRRMTAIYNDGYWKGIRCRAKGEGIRHKAHGSRLWNTVFWLLEKEGYKV